MAFLRLAIDSINVARAEVGSLIPVNSATPTRR